MSIPASFRSVLARDGFDGLYCCPALDRPALDAGGNALLEEIEGLIARYPPYSEEREQFSIALYGTSEMLKIDGEGRVVLSETLKAHAGIRDAVAFVGLGHKFQIWEPRPFSRAARGGHREGARVEASGWAPGCGEVRTEHGNDDGQRQRTLLSLADWPATFPCSVAQAVEFLRRATAASMSTAPSAPAATRAPSSPLPIARHRHRPRPERDRAPASALCDAAGERLTLVEDRFSALDAVARSRARRVSTASCSISAYPRCSSMRPSAASRSARRPARHAHGRQRADAPPNVVAAASERDLASIIAVLGEEGHARAVARAIVARAPGSADPHHRALAEIVAQRRARAPARFIRRRARSRRCASSSTRNSRSWSRRLPAAERDPYARRAAGGGVVSIRSKTASMLLGAVM